MQLSLSDSARQNDIHELCDYFIIPPQTDVVEALAALFSTDNNSGIVTIAAIIVYTINNESKYLLVQGIPAVGAHNDLLKLFSAYGEVEDHKLLDEYPAEEYTEVFWIKFRGIQSARTAKRKLDDYNFYGGALHVCYAPEFESVNDTREKLQDRRRAVAARIKKLEQENAEEYVTKANKIRLLDEKLSAHNTDETNEHKEQDVEHKSTASSEPVPSNVQASHGTPWAPLPPSEKANCFYGTPQPHYQGPPPLLPPPPPQHYPHVPHSHNGPHGYIYPSMMKDTDIYDNVAKPAKQCTKLSVEPGRNTEVNNKPTVEGQIVKNYKVDTKVKPKFIPRQVIKKVDSTKLKVKGLIEKSAKKPVDIVNENLRQAALKLGDKIIGPQPQDEEKHKTFTDSEMGSVSVDKTVANIRKRVLEFSAKALPLQLVKRKKENLTSVNKINHSGESLQK